MLKVNTMSKSECGGNRSSCKNRNFKQKKERKNHPIIAQNSKQFRRRTFGTFSVKKRLYKKYRLKLSSSDEDP